MSQVPRPMDHPPALDLPRAQPATPSFQTATPSPQTATPSPQTATPSFQEAIALTASALDAHAAGRLPLLELAGLVSSWVSQVSGARGFFVAYLTGDWAIADDPPQEILASIASAPAITAGLLVKNVAMAAAMTLTHARQQHPELAAQSKRTRDRAAQILLHLLRGEIMPLPTSPAPQSPRSSAPTFTELATQDLQILQWQASQPTPSPNPPYPDSDRHGAYQTFLERWSYDREQRSHIATVLAHVLTQAALPAPSPGSPNLPAS